MRYMYIVYTFDRFKIYRVETYSYAYAIARTSVNGIKIMRNKRNAQDKCLQERRLRKNLPV